LRGSPGGGSLFQEFQRGIQVLEKESLTGAKRFVDGAGRHGTFE